MSEFADELTSDYPAAESQVVFRSGRVIDVRTDRVRMPDGGEATRDVVVHPGAVGIIAIDDNGRVLLIHQYRHATGRRLWEPPAGLLDVVGEDPLVAARRELYEEAHLEADRWDVLVDAYTSPGMTDEAVRIYLAREVREAQQPRFAGEHEEADMPVKWVPLPEAVAAVLGGRLHNPLAVMGILAAAAAYDETFVGLRRSDAPWPEMSDFPGSGAATATAPG
ncbi:MAG TPA: NUDIX hydrolase [Mycobacteriales bacterium]|nr:NUDIX hydrolase [Mycobacteriales bacterium]